jgi:hypothetical protein
MGTVHFFLPDLHVPAASAVATTSSALAAMSISPAATAATTTPSPSSSVPAGAAAASAAVPLTEFDWSAEYEHSDELYTATELTEQLRRMALAGCEPDEDDEDGAAVEVPSAATASASAAGGAAGGAAKGAGAVPASAVEPSRVPQYALIRFEGPLRCPARSLLIASKLDSDVRTYLQPRPQHQPQPPTDELILHLYLRVSVGFRFSWYALTYVCDCYFITLHTRARIPALLTDTSSCRLAFSGTLLCPVDASDAAALARLRIFKRKQRQGIVDHVLDEKNVVGAKLFGKEANLHQFTGLRLDIDGARGKLDGSYGSGGKFRVHLPQGIPPSLTHLLPPEASASARGAPPAGRGGRGGRGGGRGGRGGKGGKKGAANADAPAPVRYQPRCCRQLCEWQSRYKLMGDIHVEPDCLSRGRVCPFLIAFRG